MPRWDAARREERELIRLVSTLVKFDLEVLAAASPWNLEITSVRGDTGNASDEIRVRDLHLLDNGVVHRASEPPSPSIPPSSS